MLVTATCARRKPRLGVLRVPFAAIAARRARRDTVCVDRVADALWRSGSPPFDGLVLSTACISTAPLVSGCARVVELLEAAFPLVTLLTAEDWLEHDGFVSEPRPATWCDVRGAVASAEALIGASPVDTYVRRAWLGEGAFYFRWHYYDEGDSPFAADPAAGGDLDLTAHAEFVVGAVRELTALGITATTEPASTFFDRRWNG